MIRNTDQTKTLLEAWDALIRFKWRLVLVTFGVIAVVLVGSFFLPRKYKAEGIFERRTDMVLSEIVSHGASDSLKDSHSRALVEEVSGQIAIERMIETLKASKDPNIIKNLSAFKLDNLSSELARRVNVTFDVSSKEFDRVRVSFTHSDQELAKTVVNQLVHNYIDLTRHLIDGRLEQTAGFFRSEVDRHRGLIEDQENKKLTFEIDHAELLPDYPGSIQVRLTEAQKELASLQQERDAMAMRVEALGQMIESTPRQTPQVFTSRNPRLQELEDTLRELNGTLEQFTGVYKMTAKHPDLQALRDQIAGVKIEIENTPEEVVTQKHIAINRKREDLEVQLSQANTTLQAMEQHTESLKQLIGRLNVNSAQLFPVRSEYRKLSRNIEQSHRQLAFWEGNLRRVEMALTAETGKRGIQLEFVKPCEVISKPVSPNLVQVLMVAVVLGLASGCVSVFFAYRTDESFRDGDQLATVLGLPLTGTVSEIISKKHKAERVMRNLVLYPLNTSAMAAALVMIVGLLYLNLEKPHLYKQFKENPTFFLSQRLSSSTDSAVELGKE